jgi:hypothetical protein
VERSRSEVAAEGRGRAEKWRDKGEAAAGVEEGRGVVGGEESGGGRDNLAERLGASTR